jgi:hypothetical protein
VAGRPELLFGKVIVVVRVLEFVESIAIQVKSGDEAEIMRCFGKSRQIIDISIFLLADLRCFLQMFSGGIMACFSQVSLRCTVTKNPAIERQQLTFTNGWPTGSKSRVSLREDDLVKMIQSKCS